METKYMKTRKKYTRTGKVKVRTTPTTSCVSCGCRIRKKKELPFCSVCMQYVETWIRQQKEMDETRTYYEYADEAGIPSLHRAFLGLRMAGKSYDDIAEVYGLKSGYVHYATEKAKETITFYWNKNWIKPNWDHPKINKVED